MKALSVWLFSIICITSCVQIPQESIELSRVIGEDLKEIYRAHIALVNLHYIDIEKNINSFVDNVYAPYQIGNLLNADIEDMKNGLDDTMSGALAAAPNDSEAAKMALDRMEIFVLFVRQDIEDYRKELLDPIKDQRKKILNQLDVTYTNVIAANATISAHLSSIKKVKEIQSDLLEQMGFDRNINEQMGLKISEISGEVNNIIDIANSIDIKSDGAIDQFNKIKNSFSNLNK